MRIRYRQRAFTLTEIMIVVAIFGILMMIALPGWIHAREKSSLTICAENLTKIDHAKEIWAFENKKQLGEEPTEDELYGQANYIRDTPRCPANGDYTIMPLGQVPECSLSSSKGHFLAQ